MLLKNVNLDYVKEISKTFQHSLNFLNHLITKLNDDESSELPKNIEAMIEIITLFKDTNLIDQKAGDIHQFTPLLTTACHGHDQLIVPLLEAGASLDTIDTSTGDNVLHVATLGNNISIIETLSKQISPEKLRELSNAKNHEGNTPCHIAFKYYPHFISLFIQLGARTDIPDSQDRYPISILGEKLPHIQVGKNEKEPAEIAEAYKSYLTGLLLQNLYLSEVEHFISPEIPTEVLRSVNIQFKVSRIHLEHNRDRLIEFLKHYKDSELEKALQKDGLIEKTIGHLTTGFEATQPEKYQTTVTRLNPV